MTLAADTIKAFGPILYNMYGSTEVAYATIATPDDLAAEPGRVGRVVRGSVVKIFADGDREAPAGTPGRIFVASSLQFEGYTGGGTKDSIHGLIATGDVGHFDQAGRLFIDGRDDAYGQRLRSYVVLRPGASLTEQDVKDYVKQPLARFKVPRDVVFVDTLPRNPTGKVVKRELDGQTPGP